MALSAEVGRTSNILTLLNPEPASVLRPAPATVSSSGTPSPKPTLAERRNAPEDLSRFKLSEASWDRGSGSRGSGGQPPDVHTPSSSPSVSDYHYSHPYGGYPPTPGYSYFESHPKASGGWASPYYSPYVPPPGRAYASYPDDSASVVANGSHRVLSSVNGVHSPCPFPPAPRPNYYRGEPPPRYFVYPPTQHASVYGMPPPHPLPEHQLSHHGYPHPHVFPHPLHAQYYPPTPHVLYGSQYAPPTSSQPTLVELAPAHPHKAHKRTHSDRGEDGGPKPKRPRKGGKPGGEPVGGSTRRSPNTKRRVDTAHVAIHNVRNGVSSTSHDDKDQQMHPELQLARCMSNRYKSENFPRCVACTRRWAGDTCRFQGIRYFLKDARGVIVGASFVENQSADGPNMRFPTRWNRALDNDTRLMIKVTVARALLPTLKQELEHLNKSDVIRRPRESDVRATCDTCMTSIFSASWMCRLCGREACAECYETVRTLTEPRPGAGDAEVAAQQARREAHAHANPFFLSCTRRNEHTSREFLPTSRFHRPELTSVVQAMEELLDQKDKHTAFAEVQGGNKIAAVQGSPLSAQNKLSCCKLKSSGGEEDVLARFSPAGTPASMNEGLSEPQHGEQPMALPISPEEGKFTSKALSGFVKECSDDTDLSKGLSANHEGMHSTKKLISPGGLCRPAGIAATSAEWVSSPQRDKALQGVPSLHTHHFADGELSEQEFSALLKEGEPVVVTGLSPHFSMFTPSWFVERHRSTPCATVDCQAEVSQKATVESFFALFGKHGGERLKLKDWPPTGGFRNTVPELWEALQRGLPMGSFCRRDGVFNLASHFPGNMVAPELGPRMYCAMETTTEAGSRGSTRLHMNTADGVNVMIHAEECADGSLGVAVWDLYRAEDAPKIRKYLRRRSDGAAAGTGVGPGPHDPILSGIVYLDDAMCRELWEEHGVCSHRVYQHAGDVVFIPAGVAYQVANLADCIKISLDFVSPENITRCEQLMDEFREQNHSMAWREDSLQLQTMMWFAWLSCSRQEEEESNSTVR